jgi:maltoporin
MTCFGIATPGSVVSKYRLGNECEVWGEFHFRSVVHAGDDGSVASLHFMPTVYVPTTSIGYSPNATTSSPLVFTTSTGAMLAFPNLYADIQGIPWLSGGTAWMGTRYYKRESIYISDFFYWNPSGVGGGIEDINLGRGVLLSYAAFAVDGDPAQTSSNTAPPTRDQGAFGVRNDLQLRGIHPWESGEVQLGFQYIADLSNAVDAGGNTVNHSSGWGVTLQLVQKLLGGDNKLAFQYGRGGGTGFGTLARFYYPDFSVQHTASDLRYRVVDVLTIQPTPWFGGQLGLVYQHDEPSNAAQKTDWFSGGTRMGVAFTEHAKLLGEVGFDRVKKGNGADPQWLAKVTIAPTIAAGRAANMRPELRLFFTWARWNQTAAVASVDSEKLYTSADANGIYTLSGYTAGMQAETWW